MPAPKSPALLIVDVQHDFCPAGALAVRDGDQVVTPLRHAAQRFTALGLPVYASRDWHPADSTHFVGQGGTWPVHCVQGTEGARIREDLELPASVMIVSKGTARHDDGYSAVAGDIAGRGSMLEDLQSRGITRLYVGGLATDYCVKASVLDALSQGFPVTVLTDAVRAVDVNPGDGDRALAEMEDAGARLGTSADLPGSETDAPDVTEGAPHGEVPADIQVPDPSPVLLDRVVHDRFRLGILGALSLNPSLTFTDLRRLLGATDGNLTVHARRLEDAGYISAAKSADRRVVTIYKLAPAGRVALKKYLAQMRALADRLG